MLGPVELVDEIDSTNAELLRRAAAGAAAGLVLVAGHQTAGRGRRDRRWEAPPGASLLVSVLLRPRLPAAELHLLTFAAGLAALDACRDQGAADVSLKWPNDVVADVGGSFRKVAGLLAESVVDAGEVTAVVLGMGLNVSWAESPPAGGVALNQLVGHPVETAPVLDRWLDGLGARCASLSEPAGRAEVRRAHRAACSTIGRRVRVQTPAGDHEGVVADVDDEGHLVFADGQRFVVGDVVHLRDVSGS